MNNSIKVMFFNWLSQLDKQTLSDIDNKLLNILIANFDLLAPLSTAGGKRAKKLSELIIELQETASNRFEIQNINQETDVSKLEILSELEIGPFRGFNSSENFIFDKKYPFLYGPNGSGKSSFFEGLEYALIGDISEATLKRIPIESYIKNIDKNKAIYPVVYSVDSDGVKQKINHSQERYRFSLIEKNRIDNFARISATTSVEQRDRIASLFGLDVFSDFVDGFTDNFHNLPIIASKEEFFLTENNKIEIKKQRLLEITEELKNNQISIDKLIQKIGEKDVTNKEQLKLFLIGQDGISGKINQLIKKQTQDISKDIDNNIIDKIKNEINELNLSVTELKNDLQKFQEISFYVNYKELYSAIISIGNISDTEKTVCPACKTPLIQTSVNPFVNAQVELNKMHDIIELQERIPNNARNIEQKIRLLNKSIIEINYILSDIEYNDQLSILSEITFTDIASVSLWFNKLLEEIVILQNESIDFTAINCKIIEYNKSLIQERKEKENIDSELEKFMSYNTQLVELNTIETRLKNEIVLIDTEIDNYNKNNEQILKEIAEEKLQIETNKLFINSYNKLILSLKNYRNKLPMMYSAGLSEKVKEYYNIINEHDTDFEKLAHISMPSNSGDKINIQFNSSDGNYDALHVLSEGHIRILGLSILLAKAVIENLDFLIFDDIVNAIDDDHKNGVAELLMKNNDFKNKKQIITCHGELFIKLLEHKLGEAETQKTVKNYRFYPSDNMSNRGVQYSPSESMHNLIRAQRFYENNELKDAAAKCRQAVENIAENIWKKFGKQNMGDLSVTIRSPEVKPDLSSVIDALIKKIGKINKNSNLYIYLNELKTKYQWNLLNKGIHEEQSLPEFERKVIYDLIELIKNIEKEANILDIQTIIVSNVKKEKKNE